MRRLILLVALGWLAMSGEAAADSCVPRSEQPRLMKRSAQIRLYDVASEIVACYRHDRRYSLGFYGASGGGGIGQHPTRLAGRFVAWVKVCDCHFAYTTIHVVDLRSRRHVFRGPTRLAGDGWGRASAVELKGDGTVAWTARGYDPATPVRPDGFQIGREVHIARGGVDTLLDSAPEGEIGSRISRAPGAIVWMRGGEPRSAPF